MSRGWTCFASIAVVAATVVRLSASVEIKDERLTLTPSGACVQARHVIFQDQPATIEGSAITSATGRVLYRSPEAILDTAPIARQAAILSASSLTIADGTKVKRFPTGGVASAGRILYARPDAVLYYLTRDGRTAFYAHSAASQRMYYAAAADFVTARGDGHANTIIALKDRVLVVTRHNKVLPLLQMDLGGGIANIEVVAEDNGILVQTRRGLMKISSDGRTHSLIAGSGALHVSGAVYSWCVAASGQRAQLTGLANIGNVVSDRAYAATLLERTRKLLDMGVEDRAFESLVKISELVPDNLEARHLAALLARRMTTKR